MSTLIEQAMQRLERLRGAGVSPADTSAPERRTRKSPSAGPRAVGAVGPSKNDRPHGVDASRAVTLNTDAMALARIFPPGTGPAEHAGQFRMIKRPLIKNVADLRNAGQPRANLIMVTSALAGEGKSFTAANLAMSLATELDHTVLLVDADVARPSLGRMLGFEPNEGLLDVLEGKVDLQEVLLATNIDKLTILPSGAPRPRATELLASDGMRALLEEMASRYADRIIIFDSPPLLLTTEASVLASHMGQIVMVVKADSTPQTAVQRALASIASHPVRLMVLNQVNRKSLGGAGYGYAYGGSGAA
ncbi:MAG: XrtA-associated tyrosine autokinase [Burkholderiaceae bacterium]